MTLWHDKIFHSWHGEGLAPSGTVGTTTDREGVTNFASLFTGVVGSKLSKSVAIDDFSDDFTVNFRFIQNSGTTVQHLCGVWGNLNNRFRVYTNAGFLAFALRDDTGTQYYTDLSGGGTLAIWRNVTVVKDTALNEIRMYVDAILVSTASFTGAFGFDSNDFTVGGNSADANPFNGAIGPVTAFKKVLTVEEIAKLNTTVLESPVLGSVGAWPLGNFGYESFSGNEYTLLASTTIPNAIDKLGIANTASDFTGVASSGRISTTASGLNIQNDSFFVSLIYTPTETPTAPFILASQWALSNPNNCWSVAHLATGTIGFTMRDTLNTNVSVESTTIPVVGSAYNIIGVYDKTAQTISLHINEVTEASTAFTGTPQTPNGFAVGNYTATSTVQPSGIVDNVVLSSGVPSTSEITALSDSGTDFEPVGGVILVEITGADGTWSAFNGVTTLGPFSQSSQLIPIGTWDIIFSEVVDFSSPATIEDIIITQGSVSLNSGQYLEAGGDCTITITGVANGVWYADNGVTVLGPYNSGLQPLPEDTYEISFPYVLGYTAPTPFNVTVTETTPVVESAAYVIGVNSLWVRPAGDTYGTGDGSSYENAIAGFSNINQLLLAPDATVHIRGRHTETLIPTRSDVNWDAGIRGVDEGIIDGKTEVLGAWDLFSGNVYRKLVGTPNIDYRQETAPSSPTVGQRWYQTTRLSGTLVGLISFIWTGSEWSIDDPDWFLMPELVWLDGVRVNKSTYPADITEFTNPSTGVNYASGEDTLTDTALNKPDDYWKGATVVIKKKVWYCKERIITGSTGNDISFPSIADEVAATGLQSLYYIENIIGEISQHGQWAYDIDTGYMYMYFDTDPTNHTVEYSSVNHGVYPVGLDDVSITNLKILNTNDSAIRPLACSNFNASGNMLDTINTRGDWGYSAGAIFPIGSYSTSYDFGAIIRDDDSTGVEFAENTSIVNNVTRNVFGGTGVRLTLCEGGSVLNNVFENIGVSETEVIHLKGRPEGIRLNACKSITTENNAEEVIAYAGIGSASSASNVVDNYIGNCMQSFKDGSAIYGYGKVFNGSIVSGNLINVIGWSTYDIQFHGSHALYTDQYSYNNTIEDNSVFRILNTDSSSAFFNNNTTDTPPNAFINNTIYDDDITTVDENNGDSTNATFTGSSNLAESTFVLPTYTLTLTLSETTVQWREVGSSTWRSSGYTDTLDTGVKEIEFNDSSDNYYLSLTDNKAVSVDVDAVLTETITLNSNWPTGAEIVVDGITYTADTDIELEAGSYTAVPNTVSGYTNDGTQNFTVVVGTPQTVTLNYTISPTPVVVITAPTTDPTYATSSSSINLGGTSSVSSGSITSIGIVNDRGGSYTAIGTTSWNQSGVTLYEGANVITVTTTSDLSETSTDIITITYTVAVNPVPVVTITTPTTEPTYTISSNSFTLAGSSSISSGSVASVVWTDNHGSGDTFSGTTSYTDDITNVIEGGTVYTVTATSDLGETSTDILTITYTATPGESFMIIEDGTIVTGANSFVTRSEYIAYALTLGTTIPNTTATDVELISATSFMESKRQMYKGELVDRDQYLSFPRYDVVLEGFYWTGEEIPRQVKLCQMAIALDINAGNDPYNPPIVRTRKSEEIDGAVKVAYFGRDQDVKLSRTSTWSALLSSLLKNSGLGIAMERV